MEKSAGKWLQQRPTTDMAAKNWKYLYLWNYVEISTANPTKCGQLTTDSHKWRPKRLYCHFWLSIIVTIAPFTRGQFSSSSACMVENSIFAFAISVDVCHGFRDVNISGFDGHVAIFGFFYRSSSQSLGDTFIKLATVENAGFPVKISTVSLIVSAI